MGHGIKIVIIMAVLAVAAGCHKSSVPANLNAATYGELIVEADSAPQERDIVYSLFAMALVDRDWQTRRDRGSNIGSILVDKDGNMVFWARDAVYQLNNSTRHSALRLSENYLNCPGTRPRLAGYTLYTTLEPCAMCAGAVTVAGIPRVVFIQSDPTFGGAHDALMDIHYPGIYRAETVPFVYKRMLEDGYQIYYNGTDNPVVTDFLVTEEARSIYDSAAAALSVYKAQFKENEVLVKEVQDILKGDLTEKYGRDMLLKCPDQ